MNLFIVESPHKATQIQGYLGQEYKVVSSKGHIRDLEEKGMSIDIEKNFTPMYVICADKKSLVAELKKLSDKAELVYLASDPDREGEAISWHIAQTLGLPAEKIRRITYNEITPKAVQQAIENPRDINMDLVNAQQARRVLDRLVGFELSPVLWRKIRRGLSAGRVQSATLRLIVDKEREIGAFKSQPYYKVDGKFVLAGTKVKGSLDTRFNTIDQAREFLQQNADATFCICSIEKKEGTRTPAAPFTTSTLQQEASGKLRFASSKTMRVAQALYERGLITYMRTDSTNLSSLALATAKAFIVENFGAQYSHVRNFKTKSRGAQEAHEAIRPTFIATTHIDGTADEQKLYNLIWSRTIASQMADAKVLNTTIKLASDRREEKFNLQSTQIVFDGFMRLAADSTEDSAESTEGSSVILPEVCEGEIAKCTEISADCKFTQPPLRYSERALIKKMEELGIGRPSTYAPTIMTLTKERGYVTVADKEGRSQTVTNLTLKAGTITESTKTETIGAEKHKLVPTEVGVSVNDYLMEDFSDILDSEFTANVEETFDIIAEGSKHWTDAISEFYNPFHTKIESALHQDFFSRQNRTIGVDPESGKELVAKLGPYGPYVQKGEGEDRQIANLPAGMLIESITLEEALKLFSLPRTVGEYNGVSIVALKGRFGPYLKVGDKNVSLPRGADPLTVSLEDCIAAIEAAQNKVQAGAPIKEFAASGISIINGRYGAYLKCNGQNYKIPKDKTAESLTEEECRQIVAQSEPTSATKKRRFAKK